MRKKKYFFLKNRIDYYPFGMPMPNRQIVNGEPYRYAFQGQEKDPETGKEAFQLRLWDGRIGRWLTTDPMGEFHSPYLGMGNNPISLTDPDGGSTTSKESPIFDETGKFLGVDSEGYKGDVLIMSLEDFKSIGGEGADHDNALSMGTKFDKANLSSSAKGNIYNHIVSQFSGKMIFDVKFDMSKTKAGKILFNSKASGSWVTKTYTKTGKKDIIASHGYNYETTVENVQASVIAHEFYSHLIKGQGSRSGSHNLAYKYVIKSQFWSGTTDAYKGFIVRSLRDYMIDENGHGIHKTSPHFKLYDIYIKKYRKR